MAFVKLNWKFFFITLLILSFAFFVWPGRYEYINTPYDWAGDAVNRPTRVDRLNGHIQVFFADGQGGNWYDVKTGKPK